MTVIYNTETKAARMTAVRDQIDAGSGPGVLQIGTIGTDVVLDSVSITAGQTVTINSSTFTHAA